MILKPWGSEEVLAHTEAYKIKILTIRSGCQTSLQFHRYRKEKVMLLCGEAILERKVPPGETNMRTHFENLPVAFTYTVEKNTIHRLRNPGRFPAKILEVQFGEILDDNDIERLEDDYGRA